MSLLLCLATLARAEPSGAPEPATAAPPALAAAGPSLDRFIEIDRRQRRVYRLGAAVAGIGVGLEVGGIVTRVLPLSSVGGTMEASGGAIMVYGATRSGLSLHGLDAGPLPWLGFLGVAAFLGDVGTSGASRLQVLPLETRQRLALSAIGLRVATYTAAILQQSVNRSGRRKLGLRTHHAPRRPVRFALSPVVTRDRIGLTLRVDGP